MMRRLMFSTPEDGGGITAVYDISKYDSVESGADINLFGSSFKEFSSVSKMEVDGVSMDPVSSLYLDKSKQYTITFYFGKAIKDASYMFYGTPIKSIDLTQFNPSKITDCNHMFGSCVHLLSTKISGKYAPSNTYGMFYNCQSLESIDLSEFNLSGTKNMSRMFMSNKKLTSLDLSKFDTYNVESMANMFDGCNSLKSLDFSTCDTWRVQSMSYMFSYCTSLTEVTMVNAIYNLSNTSNMFYRITTKGVFYYDDGYGQYDRIVTPRLPSTWEAVPIS